MWWPWYLSYWWGRNDSSATSLFSPQISEPGCHHPFNFLVLLPFYTPISLFPLFPTVLIFLPFLLLSSLSTIPLSSPMFPSLFSFPSQILFLPSKEVKLVEAPWFTIPGDEGKAPPIWQIHRWQLNRANLFIKVDISCMHWRVVYSTYHSHIEISGRDSWDLSYPTYVDNTDMARKDGWTASQNRGQNVSTCITLLPSLCFLLCSFPFSHPSFPSSFPPTSFVYFHFRPNVSLPLFPPTYLICLLIFSPLPFPIFIWEWVTVQQIIAWNVFESTHRHFHHPLGLLAKISPPPR